MHVMTKVTLSIGGVLLLISTAALVIGGASFGDAIEDFDPNSPGDEYWTGNTPTTFTGKLNLLSRYHVFVEEDRSVSVELIDGNEYSRFYPCEELNSCDLYEPGYTYVGEISVESSGTWEIKFSGDVVGDSDVMIHEEKFPLGGIMGLGGGCCGLCGALLLLIIGGIMALTLKDKPKVQTTIQIDNEMVVVKENPDESLYDQDETA
ncbi:MAG: hypothetical protein P8Q35_06705 [Candidatus Thalassarchaeaceae archaeon]|nr:hypothetical protein [Candidatus Thalassarchaeaceae archaeon]